MPALNNIATRLRRLRRRLLASEAEVLLNECLWLLNSQVRFVTRDGRHDSYRTAGRIDRYRRGEPLDEPPPPAPSLITIPAANEPSAGEVLLEGSHGWLIVDRASGAVLRRGPVCCCDDGCEAEDRKAAGAYGWLARVEPSTLCASGGSPYADILHVGTYDASGRYDPPAGECIECEKPLHCGHCQNPDCDLYSPQPGAPAPADA